MSSSRHVNNGKVCTHLAEDSFIEDLGARSLTFGIENVRVTLCTFFTDADELVSGEIIDGLLMGYTVQLQPPIGGPAISKLRIVRDGYITWRARYSRMMRIQIRMMEMLKP